jgi:hypothetical protein
MVRVGVHVRPHFTLFTITYTVAVYAPAERADTTEYTELQPLLSGVHSVMRVKFALAGEGGGCAQTPSLYIYHHQ